MNSTEIIEAARQALAMGNAPVVYLHGRNGEAFAAVVSIEWIRENGVAISKLIDACNNPALLDTTHHSHIEEGEDY